MLGALIEDPKPIRLTRIADDSRSSGFPASGEISHQLLDPKSGHSETLHRIVTSVKRLASADVVTIVTLSADDPTQLEVLAATGTAERELVGMRYPKDNSLAWQTMKRGHGIRAEAVGRSAS